MEGNFNKMINTDVDPFEEREISSSDNSGGSPPSAARASIASSKTRRGIEKRVVRIPIKGEYTTSSTTPPSDSWAWRKYGQKPIKGSPYPRGYYRCSSSKGCPARKQVERSRSDPSLLLITYSYDHNHSFPVSRNHHVSKLPALPPTNASTADSNNCLVVDDKFSDLTTSSTGHVGSLITATPTTDDFDWTFPPMETTSSAILDHPIFSHSTASAATQDDLSMPYFRPPLMAAEEEELLFADLGELPECSMVFRPGFPTPPPWCGSTG